MIEFTAKKTDDGKVEVSYIGVSMVLDCTPERFKAAVDTYNTGVLMQDAFPFLDAEQREFLMTGMTPSNWAEMEAQIKKEEDAPDPNDTGPTWTH